MTYGTHAMAGTPSLSAQSPSPNVGGVLRSWWEAYWRRRAQRTAAMMLRSLDDHCLHDIGIDRSEIDSVVYGTGGERRLRYEQA